MEAGKQAVGLTAARLAIASPRLAAQAVSQALSQCQSADGQSLGFFVCEPQMGVKKAPAAPDDGSP